MRTVRADSSLRDRRRARSRLFERLAVNPWVASAARLGYACEGLLYVISGVTALLAVTGFRGRPVGVRGAMNIVVGQPFGRIAVALVGIGVGGYILRRIIQVFVPPRGEPRHPAMRVIRPVNCSFSAIAHLGIAVAAVKLALGWRVVPRTAPLALPALGSAEHWLIFGVGVALVLFAIAQIYIGARARFEIDLRLERMTATVRRWTFVFGRAGYVSRGIAFLIVGAALASAGWLVEQQGAPTAAAAFRVLAQQRAGPVLLIALAAGLIAYGLFLVFAARYLRVIARW